MERKYGRKKPEALLPHMMLSRTSLTIPSVVDLRSSCGPIKDQKSLGSCTGHTFASAMEWIHRRYLKKSPILSPLYLYAQELIDNGTFPSDEGSDGTTGSLVSICDGCCEDSLYPDASLKILKPTDEQNANAAKYRMGAYHGLTGSRVALSVIGDPTPWPVEIGFLVHSSFESSEVEVSGIYNPKVGEEVLGGHEVLMVGYDIGPTPTLRPSNCPPAVLIQNSWGQSWGWGGSGFFWMALSVLDEPETDLKIIHSGKPWKLS